MSKMSRFVRSTFVIIALSVFALAGTAFTVAGVSAAGGTPKVAFIENVRELFFGEKPELPAEIRVSPFDLPLPNGTAQVIDFAGYTAAGFQAVPTAGQLDSDTWAATGWSDGALAFGGTRTTASTDYTRGASAVAVTTGGFYAYTGAPGSVANPAFMIQPGGSDFAPGTLTLRLQNTGATNITQLGVSYDIFVRNDQGRSTSFNFSHSPDDTTYTAVAALDYSTPAALDALGWVIVGSAPSRSTSITGLNIAPGANYYLRWNSADVAGSGSRDEIGLDNISVTPTFAAAPNLSINDVTKVEGNSGTSTYQFTVSLNPAAGAGGVTFDIATANNTATTANNDYVAKSLTGQIIPQGSLSYTFDVTVNGDTTAEANETFFVNVTNVTGATVIDGQGLGTIANDDVALTPIHDIQGSGGSSPVVGASVTTSGIVTGLVSNGFFLQEPDATVDNDPATSEGIFVFTNSAPPAAASLGNFISVSGTVTEFVPSQDPLQPPLTELTLPTVLLLSTGNALPSPQVLSSVFPSPAGSFDQLERVEGMRVSVPSLTVGGPTDGAGIDEVNATSTSNGVFFGVVTGVARAFREPGIVAPDPAPSGSIPPIPRFDGNPEVIRVDSDGLTGTSVVDVGSGSVVTNLVGPITYASRRYTILPNTAPTVAGGPAATAVTAPVSNEFTVSTYNLQRFFDSTNDPSIGEPILTATAFNNRLAKASLGIRDFMKTPDIIGVTEVENLTTLQALANRVSSDAIAASQPDPQYQAFLIEGNDVFGLDVGFLIKSSLVSGTPRVVVNSVTQLNSAETFVNPDNSTALLNDRPPLRLDATINFAGGPSFSLKVILAHQRSLANVNDNSSGLNGWATVGEQVRAKRQKQAESLATLVQSLQIAAPTDRILVIGDFNANEFNDGFVDAVNVVQGTPSPDNATVVAGDGVDLVNPDLSNLLSTAPAGQRYSYLFDGNAQALDHILVNQPLIADTAARRLEHARINADFAETERNNAASATRLSDHDPLIGYFTVNTPPPPAPAASLAKTASANVVLIDQVFNFDLQVGNSGNVPLDNMSMVDNIPVQLAVNSVATGSYSNLANIAVGEGVRVSYEKNTASGVFTLWGSSPSTATNTTLTAPPPGLGVGEYITRIKWSYGQAGVGMTPISNPVITGRIINPDNGGNPVSGSTNVQNCADVTATYSAGPTNVNANSCATVTVGTTPEVVTTGTGGDDTLIVSATSPNTGSYVLNGGPPTSFTGVTSFTFNGLGGNDTLRINNPAGGLFAPTVGIDFNGGGQPGDKLELLAGGGPGFNETYFVGTTTPPIGGGPGNNGDGLVRFTGPNPVDIRFTGLAPIIDTVVAASLTVNSTDAANTIGLTNGTVSPRLQVSVDAFEPIEFDNKGTLTINAGDGVAGGDAADTVNVDFSNVPAAITSITVNTDEGSDVVNVLAKAGPTFTVNGNAGTNTVNVGKAGTMDGFVGSQLLFFGNPSTFTDIINFNDAADANANTYIVNNNFFVRSGTATVGWTGNIGQVTLNAGSGSDTINVGAVFANATTTINAGGGADTVNVGFNNSLDLLAGSLTILGQAGTIDQININDQADTTANTYTTTATTIARSGAGLITFDNTTEAISLNAGTNNDTINVTPLAAAPITVDGGNPVLPTLPGDALNVNLTGTTGFALTPGVPGAGVVTFTNRASISYASIETPPVLPTAVTLTSSANPSVFGQSVTFTATVATVPAGGTPTGTVQFFDNAVALGPPVALAAASATFTTSTLAVGDHPRTANYVSDSAVFLNSSGTLTGNPQRVNKASTTTTITADTPDPSVVGQNYAVTVAVAPVAPGGGTPTGNVTVSDGTNTCVVILPATSCQLASTSTGAKTLTAVYSGSTSYIGSTGAASHTVNPANTATGVQTLINAPNYGLTLTATATVTAVAPGSGTPQGTVSFNDGATPIVGCQNLAVSALGAAVCTTTQLPAGNNKVIQAVYSGNANYNGSNGSATQTIGKAPLNVLASSHTVTFGDAAPAVTSTITGFVLGETVANLGTQPTCSTTYTQGASVSGSQYPTSCSGGVSGNYSFNYINGTVTVNKKGLTVTADAKSRAYGAANPALTATLTGFVGADNAGNSTTGSAGISTTATATSPVGSYPITATLGTLASTNYSFTNFVGSTLTVTAVQLTVTANNQTRVFGAPNPTLTFSITGFVNGEGVGALTGTPNISTTANATSAPGTYPITAAVGTLASPNYTFTTANGTLTVTQASTTTTITNAAALGNPTSAGQSYAVNWTTSPVAPATGTPTGNVTVTDGTATCTAAVGAGTCNLTSTTSGTKTITATYAGDANFGGSTSQAVQHNVVNGLTGNVKQFIAFGTNTNLAGVTLTLLNTATQQATTTTTDAGGNYSFSTALGQSYTITPSGLGKAFEATSRTYTNVAGNISGADFIAYDVPGPNAIPRSARVSSQIATQGQPVTVPVLITTTGVETRVSFSVEYPVGPLGVPTVSCGTGAPGCTLSVNNSLSGKVGITVTPANSNPLPAGTRELVRVTFPTFANPATSAAIRFGDFPTARDVRNAENNPLPMLYWTDGLVSFTGGTLLDGATISGRVTTAAGQGLRNATVTLIDTAGGRRTTVTSSFGAYQFEGLDLGKDYMLVVTSKRYRFATQTVNLSGNLSDVNLIGLE